MFSTREKMPTQDIKQIENKRFYRIAKNSYLYCGTTHFAAMFLLWYHDIIELALFNAVISIPAFISAYILNQKKHYNLAFSIAFFEIYFHQLLGIYLLGWQAGLQYLLLFLAAISFFNPHMSKKIKTFFLCIIELTYGILFLNCQITHKYTLSIKSYEFSYFICSLSFIILLGLLINYYRLSTIKFENELEHLVEKRTSELENSQSSAIFMLGRAGHFNDTDTGVHIWRMAAYASALAEAAGWGKRQARMLGKAAAMHDTGKIAIPDSILKKPGKLTSQEWEIMKRHSEAGYEILSESKTPLFITAAAIARYHHEKWDGSGYPDGLKKEEIPLEARIVAIADVFDALTMKRPYKQAWSAEKAFSEIARSSGSHFDPRLVEIFLSIKDKIYNIKNDWEHSY